MFFSFTIQFLAILFVVQAYRPNKVPTAQHQFGNGIQGDRSAFLQSAANTARRVIVGSAGMTSIMSRLSVFPTEPAGASTFTPGGSLVDREVGVQVGNPDASLRRAFDNSNVLFSQDQYFKFGNAAPWIEPDSTAFPKAMPFVLSQQRYDALKKYKTRVLSGMEAIASLKDKIEGGSGGEVILDASDALYALRPMGLLANSFMASENTGTTNELLLARWYINEIYLDIADIKEATDKKAALASYESAIKAANSYLTMLNRQITSKVGDKLPYL